MAQRSGFNKVWLLFAVVAVALVWTWSQVGQRGTQHQPGGLSEDIDLLRTEPDCDLAAAPCAAYGHDVGLVAAASVAGDGVRWRVRLVGEGAPAVPRLQLQLRPPAGAARDLTVHPTAQGWQGESAGRVSRGSVLRVRVEGGERALVAEFPLRGGDDR